MKRRYKVCNSTNISDLEMAVELLMLKGFKPLGGVSCTTFKVGNDRFKSLCFYQAMVKNG